MRVLLFLLIAVSGYGQMANTAPNLTRRINTDVPVPPLPARVYYIADGASGNGLTDATPMSLDDFLDEVDSPGLTRRDSIFFNRGDAFELPPVDLPADSIYVGAFGSGDDPEIIGSESLSAASWTSLGSSQYSTTRATVKWLYNTDDTPLRCAMSAWIPIVSVISSTQREVNKATVNAFADPIAGAVAIVKEYDFRLAGPLTVINYNSSNGYIQFSGAMAGAGEDMPLRIVNMRQFITTNGDWAHEGGVLYYRAASTPSGSALRASIHDYAFFVNNASAVTIENLKFKHYYKYAILATSSPDLKIQDCEFIYNRGQAIRINGQGNADDTLQNLTISYQGLRAIETGGLLRGTISNNTINYIGEDSNLGWPFDDNRSSGGIVSLVSDPLYGSVEARVNDEVEIHHNIIHNVSYVGIFNWGNDNHIHRNHIYNYMSRFSDGGAIYLSYGNYLGLNSSTQRNLVEYNIIEDGIGSTEGIVGSPPVNCIGIYMDNGTFDNEVSNNTVDNPGRFGSLFNFYSSDHTVTNNTIVGASDWNVRFREDSNGLPPYFDYYLNENGILTGNILAVRSSTARNVNLFNTNLNANFDPFDDIDNNHYINPYGTNINSKHVYNHNQTSGSITNYTLTTWRTFIGDDNNSTQKVNWLGTPAGDDILVEINPTDSPESFNIPSGYTDKDGNAPSNPYSIPAWGSLVYLKQ